MARTEGEITEKLLAIWREMEKQPDAMMSFYKSREDVDEHLSHICSFISHNEPALAYETIIYDIEVGQFSFSGAAALTLLELGLLFGYKTDRDIDAIYERRESH